MPFVVWCARSLYELQLSIAVNNITCTRRIDIAIATISHTNSAEPAECTQHADSQPLCHNAAAVVVCGRHGQHQVSYSSSVDHKSTVP